MLSLLEKKLQLYIDFSDRLNYYAKIYAITFLTTEQKDQAILTSNAYFNVKCLFLYCVLGSVLIDIMGV